MSKYTLFHKFRARKRREVFKQKMQQIEEDYNNKMQQKYKSKKQSVLNKADIKLMTLNETYISKTDLIKMYVKNYKDLGPKQRRQVYAKIQNKRSMHARKIFLKELNMLGWQFKNKTANPDPAKASLEELC